MSFLGGKKTGRRLVAVALAALVGGALACNADREDVMFQVGDFVFNFLVDGTLAGGMPGGSGTINGFVVAAVDLTVPDGFERSIDGNRSFYSSSGSQFGGAFNLTGFLRDGSADTRLPALTESGVSIGASPDGLVLLDGSGLCGSDCAFHNVFNDAAITGLQANTTYIVAFFRYSLQVNGDLDAAQVLLGDAVDQPDQLVPLGGSPAGDPTQPIESFPTFVNYVADANPFIVGNFTTDASGNGFFDGIVDGTGILYADISGDPPDAAFDSSLVARNDDTPTTFPRYNYVVILEGPATDAADAADNPQALRLQIAQDLDGSGQPINNAYAPFPSGALDTGTLLGLPVAAGQASDITVTFTNLAELQGSAYNVFLLNEETGDITSVTGNWVATEPDESGTPVEVASADGVTSFNSQPTWTHAFSTSDAIAGMEIGPYTHIFLSVGSQGASSPSGIRPAWWKFTDMAGDAEDPFGWTFNSGAAVAFGTLNSGLETTLPWASVGLGQGGFWGEERFQCNPPGVTGDPRPEGANCTGGADFLAVQFRNIQLPPEGYYYESWLVQEDGNAVSLGPLESFEDDPVQSLEDVDVDPTLTEFVSGDLSLLLRATARAEAADLPGDLNFFDFLEYRLTLTPKAGTGDMPPTTALGNVTPEPLRDRQPPEEPANGGG